MDYSIKQKFNHQDGRKQAEPTHTAHTVANFSGFATLTRVVSGAVTQLTDYGIEPLGPAYLVDVGALRLRLSINSK